jgi:hypothetical protein
MRLRPLLLSIVLSLGPVAAGAQSVSVVGSVRHPAVDTIRALLARDAYQLLDRDTVLPADADLPGDLVVVDATVRLAGRVEFSVAELGGTLFLRPGARVGGTIVSVGGLVLPSAKAEYGDTLSLPLEASSRVESRPGGYVVTLRPPARRPVVVPAGVFGLWLPTYDRVNGLSIQYRTRVNLGADTLSPHLMLGAVYHSARKAFGGEAELRVALGQPLALALGASRATPTNERWIRGDLANSASALFVRSDARDYYASDRAWLTLEARRGEALVAGEGYIAPRLRFMAERDRSLGARNVFTVLERDDPWRANLAITEGTLLSGTAGAAIRWRGAASAFIGDVSGELGRIEPDALVFHADAAGIAGAADATSTFAQLVADGRWEMTALWGHGIEVRGHLLQPLGSGAAPPQRWSFVGGPGTLPTLPYAALRGDHLVFLSSAYLIPLPWISIPVVGPPSVVLSDAVGTAWMTGEAAPPLEQSLGAGLQFSHLYATLYFDPRNLDHPTLSFGLALP